MENAAAAASRLAAALAAPPASSMSELRLGQRFRRRAVHGDARRRFLTPCTPDDPGTHHLSRVGAATKYSPTPPTPKDTIGRADAMASRLAIQNVSDQARSAGCTTTSKLA